MRLSYPKGNDQSLFVLRVSTNPLGYTRDVLTAGNVVGINIKVSGSVIGQPRVAFRGVTGGVGRTLQ